MKTKFWVLGIVLLAGLWCASPSWGRNYEWVGGTGDWDSPVNWDPPGRPSAGDNVTILSGSVSAENTINLIRGTLTVNDGSVSAGVYINLDYGTLTVSGGSVSAEDTINLTRGTLTVNDGSVSAGDTIRLDYGTLTINGGSVSAEWDINLFYGTLTVSGGSVSAGNRISLYGGTLTFQQRNGNALTSRDGTGKLIGGITASGFSGTAVTVDVLGIQFANSGTTYTLIDCPRTSSPPTLSSNLYNLDIVNYDLVANLKTNLLTTGTVGAVKPENETDTLTVYTNITDNLTDDNDLFDQLLEWLGDNNGTLGFSKGTDPSSILLSLNGMGGMDTLIWDLSTDPDNRFSNVTLTFPSPSSAVPEPATWLLLALGSILLLKRNIPLFQRGGSR
ncbi:MAG: PEP-CTERM sorting domain-containing protein [Planctomycetia bacterium]|nr:PEP-CTERM sorting domain-containing protein [Planctomycetia bacterium]